VRISTKRSWQRGRSIIRVTVLSVHVLPSTVLIPALFQCAAMEYSDALARMAA
jgi:hypothetical protein